MSKMQYKGYFTRPVFDDADGVFVGHIAGISDRIGFHADNVTDLRAAFHEAVDDYLLTCAAIGKAPEKHYSGKVMFRWSPDVHKQAVLAAELADVSLNQWTEGVIRDAAQKVVP